MGFFSAGLAAIKQTLAMSLAMLAFLGIAEEKPGRFWFFTCLAGLVHLPALVIVAVYPLTRLRLTGRVVVGWLLVGVALYVLRLPLVAAVGRLYYGAQWQPGPTQALGNRFYMICGFTLLPLLVGGMEQKLAGKLFPFMAVAALAQMLAGFDHVFSRLADYCFQLSVLYIHMAFFREAGEKPALHPLLHLNRRSLGCLCAAVTAFLVWFYYVFYLNAAGTEAFRFLWERAG